MPTTDKLMYSLNFGSSTEIVTDPVGGVGTADLDLDTGSYAIESLRYSPFLNYLLITNYNTAGTASTPRKINFMKDALNLVKYGGNILDTPTISSSTTMADLFSNSYLALPAPVGLTSATSYAYITTLSGPEIMSLLNLDEYMRFGFLIEYRKNAVIQKAYYFPNLVGYTFSAVDMPKVAYPAALVGTLSAKTLPSGALPPVNPLSGDGRLGTMSGYRTNGILSNEELGQSIATAFGIAYSDIDDGIGAAIIYPIMFIGPPATPLDGHYSKMSTINGAVACATLTVPSTENSYQISVKNTDTTNSDSYSDGYGWIGTYHSDNADDSKITITVA